MRALIVLVILLTAGMAWAFTWEGELNPNEFDQWELLSVNPASRGFVWILMKNPDESSPIDIVAMAVDSNSSLLGYRYFKYGEPHIYVFDNNQQKYVRQHSTQEQKSSCMQCHNDKFVPQSSI